MDIVYLIGTVDDLTSPFVQNIKIVVENQTKFNLINLKVDSGYDPSIYIGNFTNNLDSILISIQSGGSGGYSYYYIYSYLHNEFVKNFGFEDFNKCVLIQLNMRTIIKLK